MMERIKHGVVLRPVKSQETKVRTRRADGDIYKGYSSFVWLSFATCFFNDQYFIFRYFLIIIKFETNLKGFLNLKKKDWSKLCIPKHWIGWALLTISSCLIADILFKRLHVCQPVINKTMQSTVSELWVIIILSHILIPSSRMNFPVHWLCHS